MEDVTDESFKSVIVVDGKGDLSIGDNVTKFIKVDSMFISAQNSIFQIEGKCKLIISYV